MQVKEFHKKQTESIMDPNPTVIAIPPEYKTRIMVGVPFRKPPVVVQALLQTLKWQKFRDKVELDFVFVDNYADTDQFVNESRKLLQDFNARIITLANPGNDYGDGTSHRQWTGPAFERMANIKNNLIQLLLQEDHDYLLLLDADVFCDPYTFQSLLDSANHERYLANPTVPLPIVSGVYWTQWQWQTPDSTDVVHAGPQVWLRHPYQLHGRGWSEADFRAALVNRQRVRVWGLGACTLIPRQALAKGVSFNNFEGLPTGPMSEGEDRHFCAWAEALHVQMIADPWPDIWHAYHPQEYDQIPNQLEALNRGTLETLSMGDLVSAKIEPIDPVPDGRGNLHKLGAKWVRGKLGSLNVLPEIEEALAGMRVGTHSLVKVHYPAHYPLPHMRNINRIMRLSLLDAKPFRIAPVIDREVFVGGSSRRWIDHTTLTDEQAYDIAGGATVPDQG